jgi:hypothetical protein
LYTRLFVLIQSVLSVFRAPLIYSLRLLYWAGYGKDKDYVSFCCDGIMIAELMRERIFDDSGCDDKNDEQSEHEQTLV